MAYGFRIYNQGNELELLTMRADMEFLAQGQTRRYTWQVDPQAYKYEVAEIPDRITNYFYSNNFDFNVIAVCTVKEVKCVINMQKLRQDITRKVRPLKIEYMLLSNLADYFQTFSRTVKKSEPAYEVKTKFFFIKA